jgi:hypothetical protein
VLTKEGCDVVLFYYLSTTLYGQNEKITNMKLKEPQPCDSGGIVMVASALILAANQSKRIGKVVPPKYFIDIYFILFDGSIS